PADDETWGKSAFHASARSKKRARKKTLSSARYRRVFTSETVRTLHGGAPVCVRFTHDRELQTVASPDARLGVCELACAARAGASFTPSRRKSPGRPRGRRRASSRRSPRSRPRRAATAFAP